MCLAHPVLSMILISFYSLTPDSSQYNTVSFLFIFIALLPAKGISHIGENGHNKRSATPSKISPV